MKSIIRQGLPKFPKYVLLTCLTLFFVSCSNVRVENVSLIVDTEDEVAIAQPSQWALGQLQDALLEKGVKSTVYTKLEDAPLKSRSLVVSGSENKLALEVLEKQSLTIP